MRKIMTILLTLLVILSATALPASATEAWKTKKLNANVISAGKEAYSYATGGQISWDRQRQIAREAAAGANNPSAGARLWNAAKAVGKVLREAPRTIYDAFMVALFPCSGSGKRYSGC